MNFRFVRLCHKLDTVFFIVTHHTVISFHQIDHSLMRKRGTIYFILNPETIPKDIV